MKPEDLLKLDAPIRKLISQVFFQGNEPAWLSPLVNGVFLLVFALLAIWGLLLVLGQIKKIWLEQFWSLFYKPEQRKRRLKRQRFADYIQNEIRQLNNREEWKDYRFTELEAEIEAEGKRKGVGILPFFQSQQRGLRRERSLSQALELSSERLILVEGDPGAGKSVALRHVAEKLAQRAMRSPSIKSIIPLYINLKKLERASADKIDRNLIESFVKQELNRINDRDIEQFLDSEFKQGIEDGTWLFLFDSFDELPEVLSSVEADLTIKNYAEAIDDFLSGLNQCRGIIASRKFRGPKHLGWPQFRILPLEDRRFELIQKADLGSQIEKKLIAQLRIAPQEIQEVTKNPMFLGILCENMRDGSAFPDNTHGVFESYLDKRFNRDEERLKKRFNLEVSDVREMAERIAFCISLDSGLGLSPTREGIRAAMTHLGFRVPGNFDQFLNALEYLKLARSEQDTTLGDSPLFTFAHRRFQEYFATCIVLRDLNRINPRQLLTDGRWRDTTVVIFQTQPPARLQPLLDEVRNILAEILGNLSGLIDDPVGYVNQDKDNQVRPLPTAFNWPPRLIHLFGLLQDGFASRMKDLPDDIQTQVGRFLLSASVQGTLSDQKWSLEVAGITPEPVLLWLLRNAFASESQWLKEVAYRQTARLGKIPDDIASDIRKALISLFSSNRLEKEKFATYAHLSRLDQSERYTNILKLLQWIDPIDQILHIVLCIFFFLFFGFGLYYSSSFFNIFRSAFLFLFIVLFAAISRGTLRLFSSALSIRLSVDKLWISKSNFYPQANKIEGLIDEIFSSYKNAKMYHLTTPLYVRLLLFPLLWSTFALLAANTGEFTHPFWWLFLLLFPLLYLAFNFRNFIQKIVFIINKNTYKILISLFLFCLLTISFFWVIDHAMSIVLIVFGVFCFPGILILIWSGFQSIKNNFKDNSIWKQWSKQCQLTTTSEHLLCSINPYYDQDFCKQTIVIVSEKNLINPTQESEALLYELATALEYSLFLLNRKSSINQKLARKRNKIRFKKWMSIIQNSNNIKKLLSVKSSKKIRKSPIERMIDNYSGSEFFTSWLQQYTRKDKMRFVKLGSEFLDEVYILLEQVRAKRQVAEKSD